VFILVFQAMLVFGSLILGWLLRFDFSLPYRHVLFTSGLLLVAVRLLTLRFFKLNHGWWHFASVNDAINILKAVTVGTVFFLILNRYLLGAVAFPRSVYVLEAVLTGCLLGGARLSSRVLVESVRHDSSSRSKRVVLVGAGFAAEMVIREITRTGSGYLVVGCVDDDRTKMGVHIQGVPVVGTIEELGTVVSMNSVDEILIAIPSASGREMRRITEACHTTKLPFKTVPTLSDILRSGAKVGQFREVCLGANRSGSRPRSIAGQKHRRHRRSWIHRFGTLQTALGLRSEHSGLRRSKRDRDILLAAGATAEGPGCETHLLRCGRG
jgi:FlaA1/EpsC-like NDP-sugar epimerase